MYILHKAEWQPSKLGGDKGQTVEGDDWVEMQIDERPSEVYCIGWELPSHHHAHHHDYHPCPAPIPVTQENHAPVLGSNWEMQIA